MHEELGRASIRVLHDEGLARDGLSSPLYVAGLEHGWSGFPSLRIALVDHRCDWPTVLPRYEPESPSCSYRVMLVADRTATARGDHPALDGTSATRGANVWGACGSIPAVAWA